MSSRQLEDAYDRRGDEHVAQECGISVDALYDHPYRIEPLAFAWRVHWEETAAEGVKTAGPPGGLWSDIAPLYEPEEP
ncbi:MAG TPA: hypothetical protein VF474_00405 [Phenylobacterium sp.]